MSTQPSKKRKQSGGGVAVTSSNPVMGNTATITKGKSYTRGKYSKNKGLASFIKQVVKGTAEKKEILTSLASTLNTTQNNVILLNGVAEGTDYNQRVGREVTHNYIEVNIVISSNAASGSGLPGDCGFWAIILDRQPAGSLPAFNTMFDDSLSIGQGLDFRITSTNQDRFKIISRNEWSCGNTGSFTASVQGGSGAQPYHVKEFIDLSKIKGRDSTTNFNATSAAIGSIDSGCLYFVVASTFGSTGNLVSTVVGAAKYRFTDV